MTYSNYHAFGKTTKNVEEIVHNAYEAIIANEHKWRIDNELNIPSYEDVELVVNDLIKQVRKSSTPISVELGGILVKASDGHIDIYYNVGAVE